MYRHTVDGGEEEGRSLMHDDMPVLLVLSTESAPSRKSRTHANGVLLVQKWYYDTVQGF